MEEITGFSIKDSLSAPCLGWKIFNSLGIEEHKPIYTYNDKNMRHFVRKSIEGDVCAVLISIRNQKFLTMFEKSYKKLKLKEMFIILLKLK